MKMNIKKEAESIRDQPLFYFLNISFFFFGRRLIEPVKPFRRLQDLRKFQADQLSFRILILINLRHFTFVYNNFNICTFCLILMPAIFSPSRR